MAPAVLRHRVLPNFHADAEGVTADSLVARLLSTLPREADPGPKWLRELLGT